ncbi:MAG TPA: T9SS type A sorting domain-containing protein, partial [Flavobacteriales bacterium]|nr:T9SS type A sorting domain-containing protein [Flavobacteriales bacterium]
IPVIGAAQVSTSVMPRNAVVEEWTGIHCGYCPIGHATVNDEIAANPGRVVALNVHSGGYAIPAAGELDLRTPEGTVLDGAFPITGYPASTLNRRTISYTGSSGATTGQVYHPAYLGDAEFIPTVLGENSEVNLDATASIDVATRVLTVDVEYYYTSNAPNTTNYLNVAILQGDIQGTQTTYGNYNPAAWTTYSVYGDLYSHGHVFRGFMTGQWGAAINSTTTGSTGTMSYTQTLPANIAGTIMDLGSISIAAYVGDGNQSAGDILTGIEVTPTLTGATATDEIVLLETVAENLAECNLGVAVSAKVDVKVFNAGSSPISSATFTYDVSGGTPTVYNWSTSADPIMPFTTRILTLTAINFTTTTNNDLNMAVSDPNGTADLTADNTGTVNDIVSTALPTDGYVTVDLHTDNYGDEIWMEITNSTGTIVWSEGNENVQGNFDTGSYPPAADPTNPLGNDQSYSWDVALPALDCYTFTIYDYYGDGVSVGGSGAGYDVKNNSGSILFSESALDFGGSEVGGLVANNSVSLDEIAIEGLSVYPNPATDVLNISFNADTDDYTISLMDLQGRTLISEAGSSNVSFSVADLAKGSYIVTIANEAGVYTENVVIK